MSQICPDSICSKLNFSVVPNPWIGTVYTASHLESWKSFFASILPFPYSISYQVLKIPSYHSFLPQLCHVSDPHHSSSWQFQGSSKIPCLQSHCSLLGLHTIFFTSKTANTQLIISHFLWVRNLDTVAKASSLMSLLKLQSSCWRRVQAHLKAWWGKLTYLVIGGLQSLPCGRVSTGPPYTEATFPRGSNLRGKGKRWRLRALYNPASGVPSHHFSCIQFVRS